MRVQGTSSPWRQNFGLLSGALFCVECDTEGLAAETSALWAVRSGLSAEKQERVWRSACCCALRVHHQLSMSPITQRVDGDVYSSCTHAMCLQRGVPRPMRAGLEVESGAAVAGTWLFKTCSMMGGLNSALARVCARGGSCSRAARARRLARAQPPAALVL